MHTIVHAIAGYFFLLLTVRILSRRLGAQMTPFEFVLIFLIGGVIILATVGDDYSEVNSVCAVITVGLMHRLVSYLKQRFPRFGLFSRWTPLLLLNNWPMADRNNGQNARPGRGCDGCRAREGCKNTGTDQIRRPGADRLHQHYQKG